MENTNSLDEDVTTVLDKSLQSVVLDIATIEVETSIDTEIVVTTSLPENTSEQNSCPREITPVEPNKEANETSTISEPAEVVDMEITNSHEECQKDYINAETAGDKVEENADEAIIVTGVTDDKIDEKVDKDVKDDEDEKDDKDIKDDKDTKDDKDDRVDKVDKADEEDEKTDSAPPSVSSASDENDSKTIVQANNADIEEETTASKVPNDVEHSDTESATVDKDGDEEYIVESILDKRIDEKGFASYLVKWEGYPTSANTWEPLQNLVDCEQAMQMYELRRAQKLQDKYKRKRKASEETNGVSKKPNRNKKPKEDYEVDQVLGLTMVNDEKYFLVSLKGESKKTFLRSTLAHKVFPGKVIDFYLQNLRWIQKNPSD